MCNDRIRRLSQRMEQLLPHPDTLMWPVSTCHRIQTLLLQCENDSERLAMLDWAAMAAEAQTKGLKAASLGPSLFVDDVRVTVSSAPAVIRATAITGQYATLTGIVFETKADSKSIIRTTPPETVPARLQAALTGLVQGGTPIIASDCTFLGIHESSLINPATTTLRQLERKGDLVARNMCLYAVGKQWPLIARRFCIERAPQVIRSLLPLVLGSPMAPPVSIRCKAGGVT